MLCEYMDPSVRIGGSGFLYQELDQFGNKNLDINFYLSMVDHGRIEGEPRTFYPLIFGGGNP